MQSLHQNLDTLMATSGEKEEIQPATPKESTQIKDKPDSLNDSNDVYMMDGQKQLNKRLHHELNAGKHSSNYERSDELGDDNWDTFGPQD